MTETTPEPMTDDQGGEIDDTIAKFDLDEEFPEFKGWEAIGFHRALGKELWQIVIEQIVNAMYLFVMMYFIPSSISRARKFGHSILSYSSFCPINCSFPLVKYSLFFPSL